MKKALLTLIALSVSVSLFAQGTVVFSNVGANKNVKYDANGDGVADRDLAAADGVQMTLWFAPAGTTDLNAGTWQMLGNPASLIAAGLFSGGNRTVPGAANGTVYSFQVRAWETAVYGTASTGWEAARAANGKISVATPLIETVTGGFGSPPGPAVNLAPLFGAAAQPNILVGQVPEPSVLALGVLGVGALLMLRRRK